MGPDVSLLRWIGWFADQLIGILSSRTLLGLCALVLAGCAVFWATGLEDQSREQECRDRIDATLMVETARALQRIEGYQSLRDASAYDAAAVVIYRSDEALDAYERAITRREHAVVICAGR